MAIKDLFSAAAVMLDLEAANKRNLLESLADEAAARLGRPKQEILEALQAREQLGSTALGRGVALPHAQLRGADRPLLLFARLRRPLDFDAKDEEPVNLIVLVLWPEASPEGFLPALSEIVRALREPHVLRALRRTNSPDEVVALMHGGAATVAGAPEPD